MSEQILTRIIAFVYDQGFGYKFSYPLMFKEKKLTRETTLEGDLNISGDDADLFVMAFGREFGVDISTFGIDEYFYSESDQLMRWLVRMVGGKKALGKKAITIGDLERSVISGRLDHEAIRS